MIFSQDVSQTANLTTEQKRSFAVDGFVRLPAFIGEDVIASVIRSTESLQTSWILNNLNLINGQRIHYGADSSGRTIVEHIRFANLHSPEISDLARVVSRSPLRTLFSERAEFSLRGDDGVIFSQVIPTGSSPFIPSSKWITRRHEAIINLYLDDVCSDDGVVYIVPGSHRRSIWRAVWNQPESPGSNATALKIKKGDILICDSRLRHRNSQELGIGGMFRMIQFPVIRRRPSIFSAIENVLIRANVFSKMKLTFRGAHTSATA